MLMNVALNLVLILVLILWDLITVDVLEDGILLVTNQIVLVIQTLFNTTLYIIYCRY